jgi:hypothetical protein
VDRCGALRKSELLCISQSFAEKTANLSLIQAWNGGVMADDPVKSLEARVARLEAALAQQPSASAAPRIPIYADPPAPPWWGGGYGGYRPVPIHWPIGDPAPIDYNRIYADPPPWGGSYGGYGGYVPVHRPIGDPPPIDYSRLPASQLEATLHSINAEKARLASIEAQVTQHLAKQKEKG